MTYIDDLDELAPINTAKLKTIIAELQTIKTALKNTFAGLDNRVNATPADFNRAVGLTSSLPIQLIAVDIAVALLEARGTYHVIQYTVHEASVVAENFGFQFTGTQWIVTLPLAQSQGQTDSSWYSIHIAVGGNFNISPRILSKSTTQVIFDTFDRFTGRTNPAAPKLYILVHIHE